MKKLLVLLLVVLSLSLSCAKQQLLSQSNVEVNKVVDSMTDEVLYKIYVYSEDRSSWLVIYNDSVLSHFEFHLPEFSKDRVQASTNILGKWETTGRIRLDQKTPITAVFNTESNMRICEMTDSLFISRLTDELLHTQILRLELPLRETGNKIYKFDLNTSNEGFNYCFYKVKHQKRRDWEKLVSK